MADITSKSDTADTPPLEEKKTLFQRPATKTLLVVTAVLVLVGWLLNTPEGLVGKADAVGYALCHQIPERSFQINGEPIALCARCTGMYVGAMLAIIYQLLLGRRRGGLPEKKHLIMLGIFFLAFAVDGSNSALKLFLGRGLLYEPSNTLRLFTGTGMGVVLAAIVLPTFHQTTWTHYNPRPYFESWKSFVGLVLVGLASALLILTEQPAILYIFSFIGVAGVIVLLVMLYSMILMVIFGGENKTVHFGQLTPWLLGGVIVAFVHIGAIDFTRFLLTGTWDGFHLTIG